MPLKTHPDETPALNLTAMLDVMFLLIIFFMLGTRFADQERQIALQVPTVVNRARWTPRRSEKRSTCIATARSRSTANRSRWTT